MTRCYQSLVTITLMLAATTALAHPGHGENGFTSGLLHPLHGLDHLLAIAAIGFWSVRQSTLSKNAIPALVLGGMVLGAMLAWGGLRLPGVETGITLSVLVAGVLVATLARLPAAIGGVVVVSFMIFHGYAHGAEMPANVYFLAYAGGFGLATLAIAFAGRGLGAALMKVDNRLSRAVGVALAVTGAFFAA